MNESAKLQSGIRSPSLEVRRVGCACALRRDRGWGDDEVVFLYSGNLGRGHVVGPFLEAAREAAAAGMTGLRWVFSAYGPRLDEVLAFRAAYPGVPLEVIPPVAADELDAHLASADIHLASLAPPWSGCMVPSKIQGSFAAGRPVLFVGPADSSPAIWIRESGGGWCVEADGSAAAGIVRIAAEPGLKADAARRGGLAHEFARREFDRETNIRRIVEALVGEGEVKAGMLK